MEDVDEEELLELDMAASARLGVSTREVDIRILGLVLARHEFRFRCAIFDEAHLLKTANSTIARMCRLIPASVRILMSATPTLNRVEDLQGLAAQLWVNGGLPDFTLPEDTKWHYMATSFQPRRWSWEAGIAEPGTDEAAAALFQRKYAIDQAITKCLFLADADFPGRDDLMRYTFSPEARRWWMLHPEALSEVKTDSEQAESDEVFKAIVSTFTVRINMSRPIDLPGGGRAYPRLEMPPVRVSSLEVGYKKHGALVARVITNMLSHIDTPKPIAADQAGTPQQLRDQAKAPRSRVTMALNRIMWIASVDWRMWEAMLQDDITTTDDQRQSVCSGTQKDDIS